MEGAAARQPDDLLRVAPPHQPRGVGAGAVVRGSPVFRSPDEGGAEDAGNSGLPPELEPPPPDTVLDGLPPYHESEDDDNDPLPVTPPPELELPPPPELEPRVAAGPPAFGDNEWFCHQCARVIRAPNDPGNPQCGGCGGYFVEMRPVAPPPAFLQPPFAVRRRHVPLAHRVNRGRFVDDDDDEDFADGMSGLLRGLPRGMERRRPLTDDERMERLLAALIGTSAQRRAEGGGRPGEFDVEQLLSLFVQRAIRIQEAEGGGAGAGGPPPAGGTTPTSRRAIESLSAVTADDSHAGDSCTICFEEFEAGSSEVLSLPCEHFFCKACILPWLEKTNSCPVCRHELETEEPPDTVPPPPPDREPTMGLFGEANNPLAMAMHGRRGGPMGRPVAARVRAGGRGGPHGLVVFPIDDGRRGGGPAMIRLAEIGQGRGAMDAARGDAAAAAMEVEDRAADEAPARGRRRRRGAGRCCIM